MKKTRRPLHSESKKSAPYVRTRKKAALSDILTCSVFLIFLFVPVIFYILLPSPKFLENERRAAKSAPEADISSLLSRDYYDDLEASLLDSFFAREQMIAGKNRFCTGVLMQTDVDGIMRTDDGVAKLLIECDRERAAAAAETFDRICSKYLSDAGGIYLSVIPGKSAYLLQSELECYEDCFSIVDSHMKTQHTLIDISGTLCASDYYKTDIHWRQEALVPTARYILSAMGKTVPELSFDSTRLGEFVGTTGEQSYLCDQEDTLVLLSSEDTEKAKVCYLSPGVCAGVYDTALFEESYDKYDVFMKGETAEGKNNSFIRIDTGNPGGKLIIFRDSFARSLAPLLLGSYSEVALVDLRADTSLFDEYPELFACDENTDVLFLVSAQVINTTLIK